MANRYWVGNGGTWDGSSTTHWSATSGGAGGASVPTSADSVYFDTNSFTALGGVVTLTGYVPAYDIVFAGARFTPKLKSSGGATLLCYGNCTLISAMTTEGLSLGMVGTGYATQSLASGGQRILWVGTGAGGTILSLSSNLAVGDLALSENDVLYTNNYSITGTVFTEDSQTSLGSVSLGTSSGYSEVDLGSSTITCLSYYDKGATYLTTFGASSATFNISSSFLSDGRLSYGTINLTGTGTHTLQINGTVTTLATTAVPSTISVNSGSTTVVNFNINGTAGNLVTMQPGTPGYTWTLYKASGAVTCDYLSLTGSLATGGASWSATHSTDGGGNTGWSFGTSATTTPTGIATTSAIGTMTSITGSANVAPAGIAATSSEGTSSTIVTSTIVPGGVEAVGYVGTCTVFADNAFASPGGVSRTSIIGTVTVHADAVAAAIGARVTSYTGNVGATSTQSPVVYVAGIGLVSGMGVVIASGPPPPVYPGPRCTWSWWGRR